MYTQFKNYLTCSSGQVALLMSLSVVAVLGASGAAIDYGNAAMTASKLQSLVDSAAIAGVSTTLIQAKQVGFAEAFFYANRGQQFANYKVNFAVDGRNLKGTASGTVTNTFLNILGINTVDIGVKSLATAAPALEPICVMAMHPTRKHTLEMKQSVKIYAPDCNFYGNSTDTDDVIDPHTSQNEMTGKYIGTIGGGHHYIENVHPQPFYGTERVADPLSGLAISAVGSCTQTNFIISNTTTTLPEGRYCGGLKITNGAKVTLQDGGTYQISGSSFQILNSELTGKDVTIILTDAGANINWQNSVITLAAKKTGTYAGLAVVGQRVSTDNTFDSSTIDIHGVFYMPMGAFDWINSGVPVITAKWSAFVVDGFSWKGDGVINLNFDVASSDIPYPKELIALPRPAGVRLVQ